MRRGVIAVFFLVTIILISSIIFASFQVEEDDFSIETQYSLGSTIKGWINISLDNEPTNSLFETDLGDSIRLINLLNLNPSFIKTCNPLDCETKYTVVDGTGESVKIFSLGPGESKVLGLKFTGGTFENLDLFSMQISSNVPQSGFKQLFIDFRNDGDIEWESYEASGNFYNENYGCYDSVNASLVSISINPLCEKIVIPITPGVEVGAIVSENPDEPNDGVTDFLIGINGETCTASASSSGRVACVPSNFKVDNTEEFTVCIQAKTDDDRFKYNINSQDPNSDDLVCGYASDETNPRDFEIFAKSGFYAPVGTFTLNNTEISDAGGSTSNIENYIESYIEDRYGRNCSDECIVPIKFTSGKNQQQTITISNINFDNRISGVESRVTNFDIHELNETPALVSADLQEISLDDANFSTPNEFGSHTFSLSLNGIEILSQDIVIEKIPNITSLNPRTVAAAVPTEFTVQVEKSGSAANIISYDWDFEPGKTQKTTINKATHTYNNIGSKEITVTIINSEGLSSSGLFGINVVTPKEAVNNLLSKKLRDLNNVRIQIQEMPLFQQNSFNVLINISELDTILSDIQQRNATATDQQYITIMSDLMALRIPESIKTTKEVKSVLFFPNEDDIDIELIDSIRNSRNYTSDLKEEYTNIALRWYLENVQTRIDYNEFVIVYEDGIDDALNTYKLSISENPSLKGSFLIIPKFEGIMFKQNYSEQEIDDSYYIELDGNSKDIEFSMTEKIEFTELPVFISPSTTELSKTVIVIEREEDFNKGTLFVLIMLLVIFLGFVAYLFLQQWYKRKYENYLFKNKNDLFNLVSFIQSMKKKNLKNQDIFSRLKKAGWPSEQITYIMRKYHGKRTGMFEISINKTLSTLKKSNKLKNEIKKPNQANQKNGFYTRKFNKGI